MADCFIKLDKVNGESADAEFQGYIQVEGWEWSIRQPQVRSTGRVEDWDGGSAPGARAEVANLVFVHAVDTASPGLWARCYSNANIEEAKLVMRRAGGQAQKYLIITLKKVRVIHASLVHDASNVIPRERVELAFEKLELEYVPQSARGGNQSGSHVFSTDLGTRAK